jgi:AcrR family transcriptional regulator
MINTEAKAKDRRARREVRRQQLIDAAATVFAAKGVAAASVDDIVGAAGVAKGTFYLYFAAKDDAVNAVATSMVESVADRIEAVATDRSRSPVERLLAFGSEVVEVGGEPHERDLIEIFHRPENRMLHDRMSERALVRLRPAIASIIADGIDRAEFRRQDASRAAAYVMACFGSLHEVVTDPADVPAAIAELNAFVLAGLGFDGEVPA